MKRKTARSRLKRAFQVLSDWRRKNRHPPITAQYQTLKQKVQGHYGHFGISGALPSLPEFREEVRKIWKRCRGVAAAASCRGRPSYAWSSATRFPWHVWSTVCSAGQRHEVTSQMREICTSGSVGAL